MDIVELFCPASQREQANLYFLTSTHIVFILQYQRSETNVVLIVFNGVLYEVHAHTFTVCYCRLEWISKAIYRSVTIHSKNDYDKCHLWYIYYVTVNQVMTTTVNFRSDDFILTKRNTWFSNVLAILYHGNHDSTQRLYVLIVETLY